MLSKPVTFAPPTPIYSLDWSEVSGETLAIGSFIVPNDRSAQNGQAFPPASTNHVLSYVWIFVGEHRQDNKGPRRHAK